MIESDKTKENEQNDNEEEAKNKIPEYEINMVDAKERQEHSEPSKDEKLAISLDSKGQSIKMKGKDTFPLRP